MEGKTPVDKDDLQTFRLLFQRAAEMLEGVDDELAIECEQTAEFIEGYYLPYNERGAYIAEQEGTR